MELSTRLTDPTDPERIERARRMTPEQKLLAGGELFAGVEQRMKAGIRAEKPDATEEEVISILRERLAIARRVEDRRWNQTNKF